MEKIPVYEGRDPYIFVSYAHRDSGSVLPVISGLFDEKYRVWYDEGIAPGSEWPHYIAVHLENADTVVAFVSDASMASINCENEIVRAQELGKNIISYSIDGRKHKGLKEYPQTDSEESLKEKLDDRLIGDGISGYEHDREAAGRAVVWYNLISAVAVLLSLVLFVSIIGLGKGWFDEYLPGRQDASTQEEQADTESADTIDNDVLAQAILSQIGKDELMKDVKIDDADMRESFCNAIGRGTEDKLTYFDLINDHRESITLEAADDQVLDLLKYFPELKTAEIKSGDISSLEAAAECPRLETLSLGYGIFPVDIPEETRFTLDVTE